MNPFCTFVSSTKYCNHRKHEGGSTLVSHTEQLQEAQAQRGSAHPDLQCTPTRASRHPAWVKWQSLAYRHCPPWRTSFNHDRVDAHYFWPIILHLPTHAWTHAHSRMPALMPGWRFMGARRGGLCSTEPAQHSAHSSRRESSVVTSAPEPRPPPHQRPTQRVTWRYSDSLPQLYITAVSDFQSRCGSSLWDPESGSQTGPPREPQRVRFFASPVVSHHPLYASSCVSASERMAESDAPNRSQIACQSLSSLPLHPCASHLCLCPPLSDAPLGPSCV